MGAFGTSHRPVVLTITGADLTVEAIKAAANKIAEMEEQYFMNPASVPDLTAVESVLTGITPYKIFVFEVTTVMATATYTFTLQEIAPNVETAAELA